MSHLVAMFLAFVWMPSPNLASVNAIRGGAHDCVHCQLYGADLSNTCVKGGDLEGADFEHANLNLMCMSFANFTNANFRDTNLSGANLAHAKLDGADFSGANLTITSFKGTDLRAARGLTQTQLDAACGDAQTRLPGGLRVPFCQ